MIKEAQAKANEKMAKTIDSFVNDLKALKAGRANPHMLDKILVDYYGAMTPLSQCAAISVPEPRQLLIAPWDMSLLKAIEKAITSSDLGINPTNDGKSIRLLVPQLTEERRKELVKVVGKTAEECKVSLRNIRRSCIDEIKKAEKAKEVTEDEVKTGEKALQKIVDDFIKKVDEITKEKEKEVMTV